MLIRIKIVYWWHVRTTIIYQVDKHNKKKKTNKRHLIVTQLYLLFDSHVRKQIVSLAISRQFGLVLRVKGVYSWVNTQFWT